METEKRTDRMQVNLPKVEILGMPIHRVTMAEVLDVCQDAVERRRPVVLGMVNVAKLVNSRRDRDLHQSVSEADLIAADGQGVVLLSRLMGCPLPERVAGIDIMYGLMDRAARRGYRVFFLGAKPEVVRTVAEKAPRDYPGLCVAGYRDGYFDLDREGLGVAEQIRDSRADILFVAITPPKKEIFMSRWGRLLDVPVCHGVGGSFDVFAGVVRRAPRWMQKAGLEWFYRVLQEPGRMWRRYLVTNAKFLALAVPEICRGRMRQLRGGG